MTTVSWILATTIMIATCILGCDRGTSSKLKGQNNAAIVFYGLAVNENGAPLPGVTFDIVVDSIPKDWSFDKRGEPHDRKKITAITDGNGRFQIDANAHLLFIDEVRLSGYRHLFAKFSDDGNTGYQITAWGDVLYKSDPNNPAIYIFVKDGAKEVSALPCRGGFQAHGKEWIPNKPAWPKKPSLTDVVYKPPTSQPASQPTTAP